MQSNVIPMTKESQYLFIDATHKYEIQLNPVNPIKVWESHLAAGRHRATFILIYNKVLMSPT